MLTIKALAAKRRRKEIKRKAAHRGKVEARHVRKVKTEALQAILRDPKLFSQFIANQKRLSEQAEAAKEKPTDVQA
jgi:hypothetical protein